MVKLFSPDSWFNYSAPRLVKKGKSLLTRFVDGGSSFGYESFREKLDGFPQTPTCLEMRCSSSPKGFKDPCQEGRRGDDSSSRSLGAC